jgi:ATP/maltotriose-dependent transcriptional regulator MalT
MSFRRAWVPSGSEMTSRSTPCSAEPRHWPARVVGFGILAEALGIRAGQLVVAQRFDQTSLTAAEGIDLSRELGAENLELLPRAIRALVAAIRGQDSATRQAEDVLERGSGRGRPVPLATATWALGMVELGRGRWSEALERLNAIADERSEVADGYVATLSAPDRVEAGVRAGRADDARAALNLFETWAADAQAPARPRLASCLAQLADTDDATERFEEALRFRSDARQFDLPRMELLYGEHLRRQRRRIAARTHLRAALEGFERLHAEPWAERVRAELRACGETTRKRDPSTRIQLTPQELQIAGYVSDGLSNKEIAAQMFLSKRTIDYHLRNVFVKLGVSSRTQLAGLALADDSA